MRMRVETLDPQTQHAPASSGSAEVLIIGDDLTGACDSGVAFLACGHTVLVYLHPLANRSGSQPAPAAGVVACTTDTRNLPQPAAVSRVSETIATLISAHPNVLIFKKVDSAARGNFGPEILAALEASDAALALVAPAFPHAGRTVRSGILTVRDCSGQHSTVSLPGQFLGPSPSQIKILPAGSETDLLVTVRNAIANGIRILLCDAETQGDLDRLAVAARQVPKPLLWAGSAGLAHALAATLPASTSQLSRADTIPAGRTLLFSGSPHPVTQLQLSHFETQAPNLKNSVIRLLSDSPTPDEILRPFNAAPVSSLILTGGDTASCVLDALGASSILLAGEIAPGIPWGFVENGRADGCIVVTKSGGFGDPDTLVNAFEFCRRRSS